MKDNKKQFTTLLLKWNKESNTRQMPWKGEKNPYFIWLSEIILQQTRVEQGLPYFINFKEKYPTVQHLARAPEDEVMRLWQGLGYYSRARNLHETAKNIHYNLKGEFPSLFEELKKLKGVGEYTAAAIASFAFNEKKAVVDGNVIRVLARVFGIEEAFDTTQGKKIFASLAQELIDEKHPGVYNQAIMDFGAVKCTPQNPDCTSCVFNKMCVAYNTGRVDDLPVRAKKVKVQERFFNYLVIKSRKDILLEKRTSNDIWKNLYQLPLIETVKKQKKLSPQQIADFLKTTDFEILANQVGEVQLLTHRKIHPRFIAISLNNPKTLKSKNLMKVKLSDLHKFAFPKTIHLFLKQNSLL